MWFGTSILKLTLIFNSVTVIRSLPRNHYTEPWYENGQASSEISRITQRSYEPSSNRNAEERIYDTSFTNRDQMYQQRRADFNSHRQQAYTTPSRVDTRSEDFLKPRWYNSQEKITQQQQQEKLLRVILQPEFERTDHFLTTPNSKLVYGFPRENPTDVRADGNRENHSKQRFDNFYSSHEGFSRENPNYKRSHNVTFPGKSARVIPENKGGNYHGQDVISRFDESDTERHHEKRRNLNGNSRTNNNNAEGLNEEIQIRIVTERQSPRSPLQEAHIEIQLFQNGSKPVIKPIVTPVMLNHTKKPTADASDKIVNRNITNPVNTNQTKITRPTGDIIFPDVKRRHKFTPRNIKCAKGNTFCERVDDEYPSDCINDLLKKDGVKFQQLFGSDVILEPNVTQRIDPFDENPMCPAVEKLIYPQTAKNKDNKWLFIVNHGNSVQGVKVETCIRESTCMLTEGFPFGYTTMCKQKYILRKLVTLSEDGTTFKYDSFRLPSCCACFVKSNPAARSGLILSPKNTTPAITTKKNRRK